MWCLTRPHPGSGAEACVWGRGGEASRKPSVQRDACLGLRSCPSCVPLRALGRVLCVLCWPRGWLLYPEGMVRGQTRENRVGPCHTALGSQAARVEAVGSTRSAAWPGEAWRCAPEAWVRKKGPFVQQLLLRNAGEGVTSRALVEAHLK